MGNGPRGTDDDGVCSSCMEVRVVCGLRGIRPLKVAILCRHGEVIRAALRRHFFGGITQQECHISLKLFTWERTRRAKSVLLLLYAGQHVRLRLGVRRLACRPRPGE